MFARYSRLESSYLLILVLAPYILCNSVAASFGTRNLRSAGSRLVDDPVPLGPDAASITQPACKCGCCVTTYRTPDEEDQDSGVFLKCVRDEVLSDGTSASVSQDVNGETTVESQTCPSTCTDQQTEGAPVVGGIIGEHIVPPMDYNRFCFYNCRPYDFHVGNICVELSAEEKNVTGGVMDPSSHPQVSDPTLREDWARKKGELPPTTTAPTTTTKSLPCQQATPCAYELMSDSIGQSTNHYINAAYESSQAQALAR